MKTVFLACLFSLLALAKANEKFTRLHMATISSDVDASITDLYGEFDSETSEFKSLRTYDRRLRRSMEFSLENLRKGAVLFQQDGRDIFILKASESEFDAIHGGKVDISYLTNGVTGKRKIDEISITWNSTESFLEYQGQNFKKMRIIGRQVMGRVIGIKEIEYRLKRLFPTY